MATVSSSPASPRAAGSAKRDWLAEVQSILKPKPAAIIDYGLPGIGKSSFAAFAPEPVFLIDALEDRINLLIATGQVPKTVKVLPPYRSWEELLDQLDYLAAEDRGKTLVMDTLGGAERACHEHTISKVYGGERGEKGFGGFQRGFEAALPYWREMLNKIDRLRTERGMRFIGLAHANIGNFKNPEAEDFGRYVPNLDKRTWAATSQWADAVLFSNYHITAAKEGKQAAKGKGGDARFFNAQWNAAYEAKNCFNLPPAIPMGDSGEEAWNNLVDAIKAGRKDA
jgi:hypothetical protein